MHENESFGRWLKCRRKARGLTQGELARQVGCAVVTLRKIEADELRPSRQIAARLTEQLGVGADEGASAVALARGERLPRRNNLPTPATSLVGRSEEVAAVVALLRGPSRLVTLSGAPGIGKTRLGIQVAATLLDQFAGGVYFVELAPVRDPDLVLRTIARALDVQEHGAAPLLDQLASYLHGKPTLLVLDNFEHLLSGAPQIAELLSAVPTLKVLVTSRTVLHLSGEFVVAVSPLALPKAADLGTEAAPLCALLQQYPAIALFAERARAISPSFVLTEANVWVVAAICAELDGIPLAIELAAMRSRMFSAPTLLARLEHRLDLLTRGPQDLPERQRTLRATIDWSYELLDPEERKLLRRMAIFAGGCTLDAAEAVMREQPRTLEVGAPAPAEHGLQAPIIDLVAALLDHSLLYQQQGEDGEPRFVMLATVREYALSQLAESGELEALLRRASSLKERNS
jgi:predicted ATPase/DNA-binding XRE family transcriptional regulator